MLPAARRLPGVVRALPPIQPPRQAFMHVSSSRRPAQLVRWSSIATASFLAFVAGGCFDHRPSSSSQASNPIGSLIDHPDFDPLHPERGSRRLIVEENEAGQTSQLRVVSSFWGRIVKVRDQLGFLQQSNMVVGEDIVSDGIDYLVETNSITLETTVTILHPCARPGAVRARP